MKDRQELEEVSDAGEGLKEIKKEMDRKRFFCRKGSRGARPEKCKKKRRMGWGAFSPPSVRLFLILSFISSLQGMDGRMVGTEEEKKKEKRKQRINSPSSDGIVSQPGGRVALPDVLFFFFPFDGFVLLFFSFVFRSQKISDSVPESWDGRIRKKTNRRKGRRVMCWTLREVDKTGKKHFSQLSNRKKKTPRPDPLHHFLFSSSSLSSFRHHFFPFA